MIRRILLATFVAFMTFQVSSQDGPAFPETQDTGFAETVRFIQRKIHCCSVSFSPSVKRRVDSISIVISGDVTLYYSDNKPPQTFNLLKLYKETDESAGMDTILNGKYIQFHVNADKINLIHFATAADAREAYFAFHELQIFCKKEILKSNDRPPAATYFINRGAVVKTENEMLLNSIRCVDKMKEGDTVISVSSRGEGWLDKDSVPVGQWSFYSNDGQGREFLFKSGAYSHTVPAMFEVRNIDSTELSDKYRLSFCTLQQDHVRTIPFIKANNWNYYHPDGQLWKSVNYLVNGIPILTSIIITGVGDHPSTTLAVLLKENRDEWTNEDLSSHDFK
ncbi:MAG TPA: hypothetical protein VHN59_12625 [Chitinophagaceae bacterium]|nr:hypothetical protein [Chitinophagaceae bacterium]